MATGEGTYEPREVTTGEFDGRRVRILQGLAAGEKVVVSGLFLLDSESRLQLDAHPPAAMRMTASRSGENRDPVCGMELTDISNRPSSVYQGSTFHFCAKDCQAKFDADPGRYAKPEGQSVSSTQTGEGGQ